MTGKNKAANCERYRVQLSTYFDIINFRAIQTLKNRIYRFLTHSESKSYISVLEKIVVAINATKHRSTRMAPSQIGYHNQVAIQNLYSLSTV